MSYGNKSINDLADECHGNAKSKGFYKTREMIVALIESAYLRNDLRQEDHDRLQREFASIWRLSRLALMMSELGEACEAARKPELMCTKVPSLTLMEEELADTVIRILDYAGSDKIDLENAVRLKMAFNSGRPYMHGKLS